MKPDYNPYEALIAWFADNHVAANLLMAVLLIGGLVTALTIKKEIQPRVDINFVSINVPYLGAAPEEVEEGVCVKVEEAIQDLEGIEEITCTAREGMGSISVEVNPDYDVPEVMDNIKIRVGQARRDCFVNPRDIAEIINHNYDLVHPAFQDH